MELEYCDICLRGLTEEELGNAKSWITHWGYEIICCHVCYLVLKEHGLVKKR